MHPDDINVFGSNIIDKFVDRPDSLHSLCLADFASSYVSKKAHDVSIKPDDIKSYTVPISNIDYVEPNPNLIVLKNELSEVQKYTVVNLASFIFTKFLN